MARAAILVFLAITVSVPALGFQWSSPKDYVSDLIEKAHSKMAPQIPTEDSVSGDFACIEDGRYQNPEDCTSFIQCLDGQKYVQPCPGARHFSVETQRCESPCDAHCDQSIAEDCGRESAMKSSGDEMCSLPPEKGPCDEYEQKWYYNDRLGECHRFAYGGCGGNANRFDSKLDCYVRCKHIEAPDVTRCHLPAEIGRCHAQIVRWYFDHTEGGCRTFIYGGCEGNENNFHTRQECEQSCLMQDLNSGKSPQIPTEDSLSDDFTCIKDGLYRNPDDCKSYIQCSNGLKYVQPCPSGLHFSEDTEGCESQCDARCDESIAEECGWEDYNPSIDIKRCFLPADIGKCRGRISRWYYDHTNGGCRTFIYSGCYGNENNFKTKRECEQICLLHDQDRKKSPQIPTEDSLSDDFTCIKDGFYQNPEDCNSFIECSNGEKYLQPCPTGLHFSEYTQGCESPCDARCDQSIGEECGGETTMNSVGVDDVCQLAPDSGPCYMYYPKYYFDYVDSVCRRFIYTGCAGNGNRFDTVAECEARCISKDSEKSPQIPTEDSLSDDFTCIKDGLYRNPEDCKSYIQCSNGLKYVQPCPSRLHFSEDTQKCESPCDAHCDQSIVALNRSDWETAKECGWPNSQISSASDERCHMRPSRGDCDGRIRRWYFDHLRGRCGTFIYGGCGGNGNNFKTRQECEQSCLMYDQSYASFPIDPDFPCILDGVYKNPKNCSTFIKCSGLQPYVHPCPPGKHFGQEEERCEPVCIAECDESLAGQCGWDENADGVPSSENICNLPSDRGQCDGYLTRWYFVNRIGVCAKFLYSGCRGNANNFKTKSDCENSCVRHQTVRQIPTEDSLSEDSRWSPQIPTEDTVFDDFICIMDGLYQNPEDCKSYFQCSNGLKYVQPCPSGLHFSEDTQKCESPCDAHCDQSIGAECGWENENSTIDICHMRAEKGRCRGSFKRYYYDVQDERCKKFEYGGCGGNENNFSSLEECEDRCPKGVRQIPTEDSLSEDSSSAPQIPTEDSLSDDFTCIEDGLLYQNPEDCKSYFQCSNGLKYVQICPSGLHFSVETQRCESPCDAHCDRSKACQCGWSECMYRCPLPDGRFADFFDCISYYDCKDGNPLLKKCPSGKAFDHFKSKCVHEKDAKCLYYCPRNETVHPYLPDCHKYVHCVHGINKLEKCPEGEAFDRRTHECADETAVICPRI